MAKKNNDLVCTRITSTSKRQLEMVKAIYAQQTPINHLSKSDYAALETLITQELQRLITSADGAQK
jgi:hypothetical protein